MPVDAEPHVLFACDGGFLEVTALAIASIAEHAIAHRTVHVHVALDDVEPARKRAFAASLEGFNRLKVDLIDVEPAMIERLPCRGRWPRACYLRLFADRLLDDSIRRVIYLDGDAFALADLEALWSTDLAGRGLAACRDAVRPTIGHRVDDYRRGGAPKIWREKSSDQPHINSGVLVMDLEYWRRTGFVERAMQALTDHPEAIAAPDQDLINLLFDQIVVLDPKWNIQLGSYGGLSIRGRADQYGQNVDRPLEQLLGDPGVIHFCGHRPWQGMSFAQFLKPGSSGYYYWKAVRNSRLYPWTTRTRMLSYHLASGIVISLKDYRHRQRVRRRAAAAT